MIRNQFIQDPESSPPRGGLYGNGSNVGASAGISDDPWYTSSGPQSPAAPINTTTAASQSMFSFSGFHNAPPPPTYNSGGYSYGNPSDGIDYEDFDNEPPLLEELGINFDHILKKTQAVLFINKVQILIIVVPIAY
jgi:hypothetical protein